MPITISLLSTLKASNSNSDLIANKENTPVNDSYVTKIEEYLNSSTTMQHWCISRTKL